MLRHGSLKLINHSCEVATVLWSENPCVHLLLIYFIIWNRLDTCAISWVVLICCSNCFNLDYYGSRCWSLSCWLSYTYSFYLESWDSSSFPQQTLTSMLEPNLTQFIHLYLASERRWTIFFSHEIMIIRFSWILCMIIWKTEP